MAQIKMKNAGKTSGDGLKAFQEFVGEFAKESDRAAVIIGAAKLDTQLYQLIQAVLRPCTGKSDELLDGDTPLGTFSSRIIMAHRLGLIDDELCRALHLIRKIRNSFAHELGGSLLSGAHRDRIKELIVPFNSHNIFHSLMTSAFGEEVDAAKEFRAAVAVVTIRLGAAIRSATRVPFTPCALIPEKIRRKSVSESNAQPEGVDPEAG